MMTLRELLRDFINDTASVPNPSVSGVATFSKRVQAGDVFLALPGTHDHGLHFAGEAIKNGAVAVLWDGDESELNEATSQLTSSEEHPFIHIPNLRECAGHIAAKLYAHPSANMQLVAVTGTNGKTSVTHIVAQVLKEKYGACGLFGTLGCGALGELRDVPETTPDATVIHCELARQYKEGMRYAALEASSHGLAQSRLAGLEIDVAVLTNLGRDHFDYHKTATAYAESKKKLFKMPGLKTAVLNKDSDFGVELSAMCIENGVPVLTYSLRNADKAKDDSADVVGKTIASDSNGIKIEITFRGQSVVVDSRLVGLFNASNLLAAFAALLALGCEPDEVAHGLSLVEPVPGRMQVFMAESRPMVLLDYAHTPDAMESVLLSAREMCKGKIICVFGCGGERDRGKRFLMGEIASRLCDKSILTDDNPRNESPQEIIASIFSGMRDTDSENVVTIHNRARAIQYAIKDGTDKDCVLVLGKGHERQQDFGDHVEPFNDADVITSMFADESRHFSERAEG